MLFRSIIQNIKGAGDVKVEQIIGLPQLRVKYNREQLARYGLNINEINKIIRAAFAGESAGMVFEGEQRFDLVVRLDKNFRQDIQSLERLRINPPKGELILLEQVADISIENGPMQISRDNTRRRITVGINVRDRDIQSFIDEVDVDKFDDDLVKDFFHIYMDIGEEAGEKESFLVHFLVQGINIVLENALHTYSNKNKDDKEKFVKILDELTWLVSVYWRIYNKQPKNYKTN